MLVLALCAFVGSMTLTRGAIVVPTVALASEPLYARGLRAKPSLTLALSVEFPTVGAAYLSGVVSSTDDATYSDSDAATYVGYFDPNGCYTYDNTNKFFARTGAAAATHDCGGRGFSGNFMNWASSSAVDILRYALTGGDRIIDTASQTVLQRAVLPDGTNSSVPSFYNTGNFPSKHITALQAARALPTGMTSAYTTLATTGVYVANCLDRMYFGPMKTGACGVLPGPGPGAGAGANGIMGTSTGMTVTLLAALTSAFQSSSCASENGNCVFPTAGTYKVAYGDSSKGFNVGYFTGSVTCANSIFGDPAVNAAKKCYVSKATVAAPASFLSTDPYFAAHVQVCDSADAVVRPDLCKQYPSGSFKPVGNLQKYSDQVRVAVFGYLLDQTTARYGGVLRSPMKYVGPKTYDNSFNLVPGANPLQEWDTASGVILANPNSDALGVSGAMNYLNHFGRTGIPGMYKRYDPPSELYYETLRYLQGLQPTDNAADPTYSAITGITSAMKDGFPVYTSWSDPTPLVNGLSDYSCVANNIVTIGDVNNHYDRYIPGNPSWLGGDPARPARPDYNEPDFYGWTKVVGAFESNHTEVSYIDGKGATQSVKNPMTVTSSLWGLENQIPGDKNGYYPGDHNGYLMSGIAYWAATHDIRAAGLANYSASESVSTPNSLKNARPGMRVTSFFIDVNEGGADSLGQTRHALNQFYLASKYGGFSDASGIGNPFLDSTGAGTNANWQAAAAPFDPKTYFLGNNGAGMINALNSIFATAAHQAASIAGGAMSTTQSAQTSFGIYQAKFDPLDWSGDVVDFPLTVDKIAHTVTVGDDTNATWRASTGGSMTGKLDATTAASRNIVIGRAVPDAFNGVANDFKWNTSVLETATQNALRTPPYANNAPLDPAATGAARLDYLRGDNTNETPNGLLFRARKHKLGDIVNSGIVYKGVPDASISDSGYSDFYKANISRSGTVYVGANDGMLHAFDAGTGAEQFAYVPSMVIPRLAALTSSNYLHTSYVDATPVVAEAYVSSIANPAWKTVLVSGLGAGGQGVFALDVTSPSTFGASNVMWEFKDSDDVDMGNVIGHPQIVKVRTSAPSAKTPTYRWFAVVASGVNNNVDDGHSSLSEPSDQVGAPAIFLLDLGKAPGAAWAQGTNYFKIKFPKANQALANGIVNFMVYRGNANELRYLYAGDLQGDLWKLDFFKANFSDANSPSNWSPAALSSFLDLSNNALPMFIATDSTLASRQVQSITVEPLWFRGPNHGLLLVFGTGRFLEQADIASAPFQVQSIYAVYDDMGLGGIPRAIGSASDPGRGYLQVGHVDTSLGTVTVPPFVFGHPNGPADTATRSGWVVDLPHAATTGERVINSAQALDGSVLIDSIEPPLNGCAGGASGSYVVDAFSGSGQYLYSTDISAQSMVVMSPAGADPRGSSGSSGQTHYWPTVRMSSSGPTRGTPLPTTSKQTGRLSWRQILNYQDSRNP